MDLGMDAIRGSREAIGAAKSALRKQHQVKNDMPSIPTRASEIAALERKVAELMAKLKGVDGD